jgi:hypothetical protein
MRIEMTEATEVLWLDEHHELSLTTLAELSGLSTAELRHLVGMRNAGSRSQR